MKQSSAITTLISTRKNFFQKKLKKNSQKFGQIKKLPYLCTAIERKNAGVAQLVERNLAKVEVASSSLVSRSKKLIKKFFKAARVAELVDAQDLKSCGQKCSYRFDAGLGYKKVEIFVFIVAAGVAQLVERNLAKVEVASSSLVSRSNIKTETFSKKVSVFLLLLFSLFFYQNLQKCFTGPCPPPNL